MWERHQTDFERKIEHKLEDIDLYLEDFYPVKERDIEKDDLFDVLGRYPFQLDVWGADRRPILRVNLKIHYGIFYNRLKREVVEEFWKVEQRCDWAVIETKNGRRLYAPLDHSTHEEVDRESGIWGYVSKDEERGYFIPVEDIVSVKEGCP